MKLKQCLLYIAAVLALGLFTTLADAQARVTVKFPRGSHSASAKGTITDYKYIDYVLGARARQNMVIELQSQDDKAQLVVLDPDQINVEYGTGVAQYSGELEKSGNYTVRVLLSRAEARRSKNGATRFVITFTIK